MDSPATLSRFRDVTIIRATPAKLWEALTAPEVIRQYWYGVKVDCAWKHGAPWTLALPDGGWRTRARSWRSIHPPRRLVIRRQNEWNPEMKAEGPSRCGFDVAPLDDAVKVTVAHEIDRPESKLIAAVSAAWPYTLANLKSLLETGAVATNAHPGH
jgi:uncharacterized protein YndB with AHSA1/START domain